MIDRELKAAQPARQKEPNYPTPHKRDDIFRAARNAIITFNRSTLANFTDPFRVEALKCAPTRYYDTESETSTLVFTRKNYTKRQDLKLVRIDTGPSRHFDLLIKINGQWVDFQTSLATIPKSSGQIGTGQKATDAQQHWWAKNGKTFNFIRLPAELRDTIYSHLFPTHIYPLQWSDGKHTFGQGSEKHDHTRSGRIKTYRELDHTRLVVPKPQVAILHTNRQLHLETSDFLWKSTTKYFQETYEFGAFLRRRLSAPSTFNTLRSLELSFHHREYIYFFKLPLAPFTSMSTTWNDKTTFLWGCNGLADKLLTLTHVQEFSIRCDSPFDAQVEDPWGYTGAKNGHEWYMDWRGNRDTDGFATSCQKTLVEWILTFAKEYVCHFPKVELCGAIKNSTKEKFDKIFADEREGVKHDMTGAKQVVENWPMTHLPPPCNCTTPCAYSDYRGIAHLDSGCPASNCSGCRWSSKRERETVEMFKEYRFDFGD